MHFIDDFSLGNRVSILPRGASGRSAFKLPAVLHPPCDPVCKLRGIMARSSLDCHSAQRGRSSL
jgi:hypothetical protein